MELYGSGFNAWGQLHFDESPHREENTDDLQEFTCILRGDDIGNVRASLSHTAGRSRHHTGTNLGFKSGGDERTHKCSRSEPSQ